MASTRTLSAAFLGPSYSHRAYHEVKATYTSIDASGSLTTRKVDITIGNPHEAYLIMAKDMGFAMKSAICQQIGTSLMGDPEKVPLKFHHTSRHFAHGM